MQAHGASYMQTLGTSKVPSMKPRQQGQIRPEPSYLELRERLREWVKFYWRKAEERGVTRTGFAQALGLSPPTVSNVLNDNELPGFHFYSRLHFRLGADVREMMREDPPARTEPPLPSQAKKQA